MNLLIDLLPEAVEVDGSIYAINTDFRIGIMFEQLMSDSSFTDLEKIKLALSLYYEKIPDNLIEAIKKIQWFYSGGKEVALTEDEVNAVKNTTETNVNKEEQIFSYEHDDIYIYSAFLGQYGIDLQDVKQLHWWKFRALMSALNEDSLFSKIMGYRSIKIESDMSDSDKKFYKKMKKIYALPDMRSKEEKELDFHNSLASIF